MTPVMRGTNSVLVGERSVLNVAFDGEDWPAHCGWVGVGYGSVCASRRHAIGADDGVEECVREML